MRSHGLLVRDAAADEINVMVCGEMWSAQFSPLPNMKQVAGDGGKGLADWNSHEFRTGHRRGKTP